MRRPLLTGLSAISLAVMTACGGGGTSGTEGSGTIPPSPAPDTTSNVVFSPSNAQISVPSDWLIVGSMDGTLQMPGETSAAAAEVAPDYSDPQTALGGLDGWSTQASFSLDLNMATGQQVDSSAEMPGAVRLFKATVNYTDPTNTTCPQLHACEAVSELTFGVDFAVKAGASSVSVVLLKPLESATSYIVATTSMLKDTAGNTIGSSSDYAALEADIASAPLADAEMLQMQSIINSYENAIVAASDLTESDIQYSMAFQTQDTVTPMLAVKALLSSNVTMKPSVVAGPTGLTALDALGLEDNAANTPFKAATLYSATFSNMPYYLPLPSAANPMAPTTGRWNALCDSGATLAGAGEAAAALAAGSNDATCQQFGLRDLRDANGDKVLDTLRHVTKYNPIPQANAMLDVPGWMTVPEVNLVNAVRAQLGLPAIAQPTNGWPVTIMMHGITATKETMLAISGAMSLMGQATVFIDHPLHGERGFDLDMDGKDDINASEISATHYMNLASLLTGRDNVRQSIADILAVRVALHSLSASNGGMMPIDANSVSFAGQSLGAITGTSAVALANGPSLLPAASQAALAQAWGVDKLNDVFAIESAALSVPGGGIASLLLESDSFGPLIEALLVTAASADTAAAFAGAFPDAKPGDADYEEKLVGFYTQFSAALTPYQKETTFNNLASFGFATQSVLDGADPSNHAPVLASNGTPVLMHMVYGDAVIPNQTSKYGVLGGTEPLVKAMGLTTASESAMEATGIHNIVRFTEGSHGSMLDPTASAAATVEMQSQIGAFIASKGTVLSVTNTDVVE
jgi:Pla-1/cef family extracellular lipase